MAPLTLHPLPHQHPLAPKAWFPVLLLTEHPGPSDFSLQGLWFEFWALGLLMAPRGFWCEPRSPPWSSGGLGLPGPGHTPGDSPFPSRDGPTSAVATICSITQQHALCLLLLACKALKGQVCITCLHGPLSILKRKFNKYLLSA